MKQLLILAALLTGALVWPVSARGEELRGAVAKISKDTVEVTLDSKLVPNVGDKVEVVEEIPGLDDVAQVASGKVAEVRDAVIVVKIDRATGKVAKDQLAIIFSDKPRKRGPPDAPPFLLYPLRRGEHVELFLLDGTGKILTNVSKRESVCLFPAWSPNGERIAFTDGVEGRQGVYVMDADGGNVRRLTNYRSDEAPAWSSDGKKIAFHRINDNDPRDYDIFVIPSDGGEAVNITANPAWETDPTWSPDGKRIAFTSNRSGGGFRVYAMDPDGSNVADLSGVDKPTAYMFPAWSPDGKKIAYGDATPEGLEIFLLDVESRSRQQLTKLGNSNHATWSPDSKRIAFENFKDGKGILYIMNADGTDVREVLSNEGPVGGGRPAWRPMAKRQNVEVNAEN